MYLFFMTSIFIIEDDHWKPEIVREFSVSIPTIRRVMSNRIFQLDRETGEIYYNNLSDIFLITLEGSQKKLDIFLPEGFFIFDFVYLKENKCLYLSTMKIGVNTPSRKINSFFYFLESKKLVRSFLYHANTKKHWYYLYQILEVGNKYFGNISISNDGDTSPSCELVELKIAVASEYKNILSEVSIEKNDLPFFVNFSKDINQFGRLSRKWMIETDSIRRESEKRYFGNGSLLIVDELFPQVWVFKKDWFMMGSPYWAFVGNKKFNLEGWISNESRKMNYPRDYEFTSAVKGFEPTKTGFLLAYSSRGEVPYPNGAELTLYIQKLDNEASLIGPPLRYPLFTRTKVGSSGTSYEHKNSTWFLGVFEEKNEGLFYLVRGNNNVNDSYVLNIQAIRIND